VSRVRAAVRNRLVIVISLLLCGTQFGAQSAKPLPAAPSAGGAIQEAARAAAATLQRGDVEILSDTQGVDFKPYLARILNDVRTNWYRMISPSAAMEKGKLAIEFAITKDGNLSGMKLVTSSGATNMDRAAWGGVTASSPFPPLPTDFTGPYLALRFRFFYNPDAADLAPANSAASAPAPVIVHATLMPHVSDSHLPKYPKKARQTRVEGIVRVDAEVGSDGKVKDVKVLGGDTMLADASIHAIRKWRFYPAQRDGRPVEDRARIRIDFRLDQEQVRAQVVSYPGPAPSPAQ